MISGEKDEMSLNPTIKMNIDDSKWEECHKEYEKTILLFISGRCNLNCSYCFNRYNLNDREMNVDFIEKIVKANPDVKKYDIQGGEPCLHKNINEIISYLNSKNKKVGLYTNGYLLGNLNKDHKNLKICISSQAITSKDKSLKPIKDITNNILKFQSIYPIKIVYLLNRSNRAILFKFIKYVEDNFSYIKKITVGLVRNEGDYWSDEAEYVLPFKDYAKAVQNLLDTYEGRLDLDIFTKGILRSNKLPKSQKNQICRFKNVFYDGTYVPCLYLIAKDKKIKLPTDMKIPYSVFQRCARTGKGNCLADKIYLLNKKNGNNKDK